MQSLKEFLVKYPTTIQSVRLLCRGDWPGESMLHFQSILTYKNANYTYLYSVGKLVPLYWILDDGRPPYIKKHVRLNNIQELTSSRLQNKVIFEEKMINVNQLYRPEVIDVLNAAKLDAGLVDPEYCSGFDDFAENIDGNNDSIKCLKSYEQCIDGMERLSVFYGEEVYRELIDETEGE